jgi:hypothetical protein
VTHIRLCPVLRLNVASTRNTYTIKGLLTTSQSAAKLARYLHRIGYYPVSGGRKSAHASENEPENDMASITIDDLPDSFALDHKAMAMIRGGDGAPWLYGWIQPYNPNTGLGSAGTLVQINNNFYAGQMINQFQSVNVNNTGNNSNINVAPDERSKNQSV